MKKLNESEMKTFNGGYGSGWAEAGDEYLPVKDYRAGDERDHSGSYIEHWWSGYISYIVYHHAGGNGEASYNYRTA